MRPDDYSPDSEPNRAIPATNIEPIAFRAGPHRPSSSSRYRYLIIGGLLLLFILLSAAVGFVLMAKQVAVQIEPEPERVSISGGLLTPKLGAFYLLWPGAYHVRATKPCYTPLHESMQVTDEPRQTAQFEMRRQPGRLTFRTHQTEQPSIEVEGATVLIDEEEIGVTPLADVAIQPGQRRVEIRTEDYQEFRTSIEVEGCGMAQSFDFALVPGWSEVVIKSVPAGAEVLLNREVVGTTPLRLDLAAGTYDLAIRAERYKTWQRQLTVQAHQAQALNDIQLQPADGSLVVRTEPPGAQVMAGGSTYAGKTPLTLPLPPNTSNVIRLSKVGYQQVTLKVTVAPAESKTLKITLQPQKGIVRLLVVPKDAELLINGKSWGPVQPEISLLAVEHQIDIRKDGYRPFQTKITPRPNFPQELRVMLQKTNSTGVANVIKAANGYQLKLVQPADFTMGASRREQGRRSNETLRQISLQRPFYVGVREVTNQEFRAFRAEHNSGVFKRQSLNRDELPVVQVTWEQAAEFCNWLSIKDKLPPIYVKQGETLVASDPLQTGYRLCTEAEWEYSARFNAKQPLLKYAWGARFPPTLTVENFADQSASNLLGNYLNKYNDGYAATAPTGTFPANALGLYDMGGNVAEWCHDGYAIYPYVARKIYRDPVGPEHGQHHVVKGPSWKHASISRLRLSYRDYSSDKRADLGFRICRYRDDVGGEK